MRAENLMRVKDLKSEARAKAVGYLLGLADTARKNPDDAIMQKIVCKNLIEYADVYLAKIEAEEILAQLNEILNEPLSAR